MRFLGIRHRSNSSPSQTRPPPNPRSRNSSQYPCSNPCSNPSSSNLSTSPRLSLSSDFNDARQRWSELARDRRVGLSLASEELENATASIDSINLGENGVRHLCTTPSEFPSAPSVVARSPTSDSAVSVPSPSPDPSPPPAMRLRRPGPSTHPDTTPNTSPAASRPSLSDYGSSPGPINFKVDYAELTALKNKFNQLDEEGKGFLSRSQFYDLFSSIIDSPDRPSTRHTPMFNFAYSLFHSAGDVLNLREFVTGMSVLSKGTEEDRLRYLFMMYDKDGSGRLSADEIKQVFRVMGSYATSQDFRASDSLDAHSLSALRTFNPVILDDLVLKTLSEHDLDGDGEIGFDDFVKWCIRDPIVKTWMDMLCFDTARGVARLRGESEKELVARELDSLGICDNQFWRESFNLHPNPASSTSASHSLLPPTISTQNQASPPVTAEHTDSSGEFEPSGNPRTESSPPAVSSISSTLQRQRSHARNLTATAIGTFEIDFRSLIFEKQIGSGSFAVVWKCRWLDSPVAVKVFKSGPRLVINKDGTPCVTPPSTISASSSQTNLAHPMGGFMENGESFEVEFDSMMSGRNQPTGPSLFGEDGGSEMANNRARFLQEVSLLKSIRHPNLLLYMGACVEPQFPLCIVSELIDGGSLFELLHGKDRVALTDRQKLILTQDIARGMLYLHGRDPIVLHRDLKSANILVELQNDDSFEGTIIDFGLSKFSSTQASLVPGRGRGLTGSLVTMAPEVMNEQKYEPRSDVYSYAIVCWEIWCGRIPFGKVTGATQLLMKVAVQGCRPEFEKHDHVPVAIQKLIRACWDQDIRKRPEFLIIIKMLNEIRHDLNVEND